VTSLSDVIDDVGDYEIDSQSTGSGSEQLATRSAGAGDVRSVASTKPPPRAASMTVANPARRKRLRLDSPASDRQTRRGNVQRYRFEKRTHQKVLHVSPSYEHDTESPSDVSPCQVTSLTLSSRLLAWELSGPDCGCRRH